jgi:diaminopimelate epimerase
VLLPERAVPYAARSRVAAAIMDSLHLGCEQAGFVEMSPPAPGIPRLTMMGGEFCLNATRALAVLLARENLLPSSSDAAVREGLVEVSGAADPVQVRVTKTKGAGWLAAACLRFPASPFLSRPCADLPSISLIRLPGIVHLVLENQSPPRPEEQDAVCADLRRRFGLEKEKAVGCLWLDSRGDVPRLLPLVWVRAIKSLCRESACGSGTLACALMLRHRDGQSVFSIRQPGGDCLDVRFAEDAGGQLLAWVGGPVRMVAHGFLEWDEFSEILP